MSDTRTVRKWAMRVLPWLVTGGVIAAILYKYPVDRILAEAKRGDTVAMLPYGIGLPILLLLMISTWDYLVFRSALGNITWRDALRGKAASSLLMTIGYAAGHGGYGAWVSRRTGSDVRTSFGIILYIMTAELISVCAVATVAVWAGGADIPADAKRTVGYVAPALTIGLMSLALIGPWLHRHRKNTARFLKPWALVSPRIFLLQQLGRCTNISIGVVGTWAAANAFGLPLPLAAVATYLPVILLVGALPINVAGLGAVQAAWLLFEPWAPGEQILAWQFIWHLIITVMFVVRAAPFLRKALRELRGTDGDTESNTEGDADGGTDDKTDGDTDQRQDS
jgi:hypothetical protein